MKKLTEAQQHMLDVIKANGGSLRRFNFRFIDAAGQPVLGLNVIAARSLQKAGLVSVTMDAAYNMTYTLTEKAR